MKFTIVWEKAIKFVYIVYIPVPLLLVLHHLILLSSPVSLKCTTWFALTSSWIGCGFALGSYRKYPRVVPAIAVLLLRICAHFYVCIHWYGSVSSRIFYFLKWCQLNCVPKEVSMKTACPFYLILPSLFFQLLLRQYHLLRHLCHCCYCCF